MMRVISILILFIFVRGAFSQGVNDCLSENLPLQHIYRQCSNAGSSINICKEKKSFESTVECLKNQKKARTIPVDKCKESVDDIISTCEGYIQSRKLDTKQNKVMELYLHLRNILNKKVEGFVLVNHKDVEKYSIAKKEFFKFLRFVYISTVLKYPLYVDEFIKLNSSLQSEQVEKNKVIVEEELALLRGNKIQVIIQEYHELKRSTKKTFQDTSLYGPYGILFSEELDGFDELLKPYEQIGKRINGTLIREALQRINAEVVDSLNTVEDSYLNKIRKLQEELKENKDSAYLKKQLDFYFKLCRLRHGSNACKFEVF